ncbi:MAG: Dyp-type peroxidase, partial [Shewanella sp.]
TPDHFEQMLHSMVFGDGEGHHDHLMHFTRALSGSSFFAPALDFMLQFDE